MVQIVAHVLFAVFYTFISKVPLNNVLLSNVSIEMTTISDKKRMTAVKLSCELMSPKNEIKFHDEINAWHPVFQLIPGILNILSI